MEVTSVTPCKLPHGTSTMEATSWKLHMEGTSWNLHHGSTYTMEVLMEVTALPLCNGTFHGTY